MAQIQTSRRIAEALSAKLHYDYLCYKGHLMDEAYMVHAISDVLCSCFDVSGKTKIKKNYTHPGLEGKPTGAKPSIDYVVVDIDTEEIIFAIEAKWTNSSHCKAENILWDLVRLKLLKECYPNAICLFLAAGSSNKFCKPFGHDLFKPGTQHPLHQTTTRPKKFKLIGNPDHDTLVTNFTKKWVSDYPTLDIPTSLSTTLADPRWSGSVTTNRFSVKAWAVE